MCKDFRTLKVSSGQASLRKGHLNKYLKEEARQIISGRTFQPMGTVARAPRQDVPLSYCSQQRTTLHCSPAACEGLHVQGQKTAWIGPDRPGQTPWAPSWSWPSWLHKLGQILEVLFAFVSYIMLKKNAINSYHGSLIVIQASLLAQEW